MQRFNLIGALTSLLAVYAAPALLFAQDPEFTFSLDVPAEVTGEAGEVVEIQATAQISAANITGEFGAEGWSVALAVEGSVITSATTDGTAGARDTDGGLRLEDGFESTEFTTGPGNEGVVSAVILSSGSNVTLPPSGASSVLQLTFEATVPQPVVSEGQFLCDPVAITVLFQDGLQGSGLPVDNKASFEGVAYRPVSAAPADITVCPTILKPQFVLSMETPGTVEGEAGSTVEFETVAQLTTSENAGPDGAQGWSISISSNYCELVAATVDGTAGAPVSEGGSREDDGFQLTEITTGDENVGVVSAVILSAGTGASLPPEGTSDLLRLTLSALVPDPVVSGGEIVCIPVNCSVVYVDGLTGSGQPVDNKVTYRGLSSRPTLVEGTIQVCPEIISARPDFELSLSAPESLVGPPETDIQFEAIVQLTTSNNPRDVGVQAWSFGTVSTSCNLLSATYDGTAAALATDGGLRQPDGFQNTELTTGDGNMGLVSAIVLSAGQTGIAALPAEGTADLLKVTVEATVPPAGNNGECDPLECTLSFQDGLQGGGLPVENKVTYIGFAFRPDLSGSLTSICPEVVGATQKPGDENQDGAYDISDPVALLNHLFLGTNPDLPCGDGTVSDPANLALLDVNEDSSIDLSDAVFGLNFLFLGGPPPVNCDGDPACPCIRIEDCPDNPTGDCAP